jgi:hypothetical protein
MDLPPSGWYPDPYGTPALLRWWDGSVWTHHTHPDVTPGNGNGTAGNGGDGAAVQATAVQSAVAQSAAVQATAVQSAVAATAVQPAAVAATPVHATAVQPSTEWLRTTKPPTGRPTAPQPALPATPYHTAMQSTTVQPGYPQPALGGVPAGGDGAGTQVMYYGSEPWQVPGGAAGPGGLVPGLPGMQGGGPGQGNRYGYLQAQRRRRMMVIGGISAGTVVAVAMIVVIGTHLGRSPGGTAANQVPATTPPPSPTASAAATSPTASPSPTATPAGSLLSDGQSGLSYTQLAAPWQGASCPSALNYNGFTWTAGEAATAGQVNGGSTTWYGEACSGPLPQQYGYAGSAQLQTTAVTLAQNFQNAYYSALNHTVTQGISQPVQVSGHVGWEVTYDIAYTDQANQGETWSDEQAAVVVVDNGTNQPAVFFTSVPANLDEGNVQTLVSSLALGTPASSTPTDTTATDSAGNAGTGGQGPDNGGQGAGNGGN